MKKGCLFSAIIFICLSTQAGAQKGAWMIYATDHYNATDYGPGPIINKNADESQKDIVTGLISVGAGRMLSRHFMVGAQLSCSSKKEKGLQPTEYLYDEQRRITNWQAGVFARYSTVMTKRFYAYAQFFAGMYGTNQGKVYTQTIDYMLTVADFKPSLPPNAGGYTASLLPGVGMNIMDGFGINGDIGGISFTSYHPQGMASSHQTRATFGSQFSFGIHKVIGWKRVQAMKEVSAPAEQG